VADSGPSLTFPLMISVWIELNQRCLTSIRPARPWYLLQKTCGAVRSVQSPRPILRFLLFAVLSSSSRCVLSPIPHHGLPKILLVTHVCIDQVTQTPTSGRGDSSRKQACRSAFDSCRWKPILFLSRRIQRSIFYSSLSCFCDEFSVMHEDV
jgi:hypothetical protein